MGENLKCPFCGNEKDFQTLKEWKFRFYNVKRLQCQNCNGIFNYYEGKSPRTGKASIFIIRVKPGK
ncbi:MAG: hypothetical protein NDF54_07485 [archaeon GB-1867-035]|nr:hypothetical protein [Candidatus Culexmicrobium profundum]